ncbi:hypothetical protein B0H17DRAFT_1083020 [Mycena rosella]|uniref:Uncharacterized protein n=1 Tax=Mycena rosella TaxID=1033263 RepID=A0AAD7D1A3_MYCRO|nr:hypothetical protein B0H17DRAFT_1083020 [Mycena rosella]
MRRLRLRDAAASVIIVLVVSLGHSLGQLLCAQISGLGVYVVEALKFISCFLLRLINGWLEIGYPYPNNPHRFRITR